MSDDFELPHGAPFGTGEGWDLVAYLDRQWKWSLETFGPGNRTAGVIDHITKELREIEKDPFDLSEWCDVIILAMDGVWRNGFTAEELVAAMEAKQRKNFARKWPDWRTMPKDKAIEHNRSSDHASGIEAREGQDAQRLDAEHESPAREAGDAKESTTHDQ